MNTTTSKETSKACVACQSLASTYRVFKKWGYPIFKCQVCGLGSVGVKKDFDPSHIYNEGYFEGAHKDGYATYEGSESVLRSEFKKTVEYLHRSGAKGGKLLEVGCAYGYFLEEAQRYYRCTGVEVSEAAAKKGQSRGLDVIRGTIQDSQEELKQRGPFDSIVLLDCIEHLKEPAETLQQMRQLVGLGASLVLTTGDWGSLFARLTGKSWRLMTPPQHLFYFSKKSLTKLLNQAGFEVVQFSSPWKFVPIGLALYQVIQRIGLNIKLPNFLNKVAIPINLFDTVRVLAKAR